MYGVVLSLTHMFVCCTKLRTEATEPIYDVDYTLSMLAYGRMSQCLIFKYFIDIIVSGICQQQ